MKPKSYWRARVIYLKSRLVLARARNAVILYKPLQRALALAQRRFKATSRHAMPEVRRAHQ